MAGLEGAGHITIFFEVKLGERAATIATIGSNAETVEYKDFRFCRVGRRGSGQVPPSVWASLYQITNGLDLRCRQ